jgi:hypothetical protein
MPFLGGRLTGSGHAGCVEPQDEFESEHFAPLLGGGRARRLRRTLHFGGFRSVELNVIGWSALVGTGAVLGTMLTVVSPARWFAAVPIGIGAVWIAVLLVDYRRWRGLETSIGVGLGPAETADLARALVAKGVHVEYTEFVTPYGDAQHRITFRNSVERKVRRFLRDQGLGRS